MNHRIAAVMGSPVSAALLALCSAHTASGAELGFYVTGFYGQAQRQPADPSQFEGLANSVYALYDFTPESTASSFGDYKDSAFGMAGGYRLLPHLAFEAGYIDLGELTYRNDSFGTHRDHQEPWFQKVGVQMSGFTLSALAVAPVSYRWELYGRAGVLFASNEINVYVTDFESADSLQGSESSTEWLAGVGASFSFAEVYSARFEYLRVFDAGKGLAVDDLDVMSIGVAVSF